MLGTRKATYAATGAFAAAIGFAAPESTPLQEPDDVAPVERVASVTFVDAPAVRMSTRAKRRRATASAALLAVPIVDPSRELEHLRDELHFLRYHPDPSSLSDHEARAKRALAKAETIGDDRLIARALLTLVISIDEPSEPSVEVGLATRAYELASEIEAHDLAAQAAGVLALYETQRIDRFNHWVRAAEAHNEIAEDPEAEMELAGALAFVAMDARDHGEALIAWQRRVDASEDFLGLEHPMTAIAYDLRGTILQDLGQYEAAESDIRLALDIYERHAETSSGAAIGARIELALLLFEQGSHPDALQHLDVARRLVEGSKGEAGMGTNVDYLHWISGHFLHSLGHHAESLTHYLLLRDELPPEGAYNTMDLNAAIAEVYLGLNQCDEAIASFELSLTYTDPDEAEWERRVEIRERLAEVRSGEC